MDEQDLTYSGPGDDDADAYTPEFDDQRLTGGMTPEIAAYGSGGLGAVLLALTGWIKRRRTEARFRDRDDVA